jgi:hypothetical protein
MDPFLSPRAKPLLMVRFGTFPSLYAVHAQLGAREPARPCFGAPPAVAKAAPPPHTHAPGCAGRQRVSPASAAAVLLATTRGTAPPPSPSLSLSHTHTRTGVCRPPAREPRQRRRRAAGHHARHGTSSLSLSLPLSLPLPLSPSLSPSLTRTHAPGCAGRQRVSPASAAAVLLATTRGTAPGGAPPPRCALR